MYKEYEVFVSPRERKKIENTIKRKRATISIKLQHHGENKGILLLTKQQIKKIEKGKLKKKSVHIYMSRQQLKRNHVFKGGFLSLLTGLVARALPSLLTGLASGVISGVVEKSIKGSGLFIKKGNHCYQINPVKGKGLYLSPHRVGIIPTSYGDGLFLKHGQDIHDGKGLILGANSPFKNIPILGWIL